jgi:hypothetical protein
MEKQMHLAAQYLAAAGISFVEKQDDDSHTNLGFDPRNGTLSTHMLSNNEDVLSLSYQKFSLDWNSLSAISSLQLDGATHREIVNWITEVSQKMLNKKYEYRFHYDLPYSVTDDFTFKLNDVDKLKGLMDLRIVAQASLEKLMSTNNLTSSIRVWPHHFDTGIYEKLSDSDILIGCGLAIPDTVCDDHYMYISGYKNNKIIDTSNFEELKKGEWKNTGFKGGTLAAATLIESDAVQFFQEAINNFKR